MRVVTLADARAMALELFNRQPPKPVLIGQVSLVLGGKYGLNECETLLEEMVREGLLRPATREELKKAGVIHGYMLAEPSKVPA